MDATVRLALAGAAFAAAACASAPSGAASAANPQGDASESAVYGALLGQALERVKSRRPAEALPILDKIDRHYSAAHPGAGKTVYCSHNPTESLLYLTKAAAEGVSAVALSGVWCDAIYDKAYALVDLNRPDEAARQLDRALALAPDNPQYLGEKGQSLTVARRWEEAITIFRRAEDDHVYATRPQDGAALASRACRGIGYVQVEEKKLDEAEATYQRCLRLDPDDDKSRNELRYIADLRKSP